MQLAIAQPCTRPAGCRTFTSSQPRRFVGENAAHEAAVLAASLGGPPSRRRRCLPPLPPAAC